MMRQQIHVLLHKQQEFQLALDDATPMTREEARNWLDGQFVALDCEPLRASGKVLSADKVLRVAEAADPSLYVDPVWSHDFARAVSVMLGKPSIRIDVPAMAVTY
jgi:hypothetical protein